MKYCTVYKTNTGYKIITESESDIGVVISDSPIYILPIDSLSSEIEFAVFDCLNKSRKDIKTPKREEWSNWQKDLLRKMNEKSFTTLYKNSSSCNLKLDNDVLYLTPNKLCRQDDPKAGLCSIKSLTKKFEYSTGTREQIVSELILMLNIKHYPSQLV